jgi:hypothetical protein
VNKRDRFELMAAEMERGRARGWRLFGDGDGAARIEREADHQEAIVVDRLRGEALAMSRSFEDAMRQVSEAAGASREEMHALDCGHGVMADPIFDLLATAALEQGFGEEEITVGVMPGRAEDYVLRLDREGAYVQQMVSAQVVEDAAFDLPSHIVRDLEGRLLVGDALSWDGLV